MKLASDLDGQGLAKAIGFLDPTSAQHLATKAYVDALVQGLDVKGSVTAVAAANITLSGTQTIDGVAVTAGQLVLATGQTTASQNGPWTVAAGAWTRPANFASGATVQPGAYLLVDAGTAYKGHGFVMVTSGNVTVDTTSQTWQEFTGAGDLVATSPVVLTGNTISLSTVPVNKGGTGATDAAGAKTNLGFLSKYAATVGDGTHSSFTLTHGLGTTDLANVLVYRLSDGAIVEADVVIVDGNNITVTFGFVPSNNTYRVIISG